MTITLNLQPETEARLLAAAAQQGVEPAAYAESFLSNSLVLHPAVPPQIEKGKAVGAHPRLSISEINALLDEAEVIGRGIPMESRRLLYSREDIYFDHD